MGRWGGTDVALVQGEWKTVLLTIELSTLIVGVVELGLRAVWRVGGGIGQHFKSELSEKREGGGVER